MVREQYVHLCPAGLGSAAGKDHFQETNEREYKKLKHK